MTEFSELSMVALGSLPNCCQMIDCVRLNVPPTHYRSYGDGTAAKKISTFVDVSHVTAKITLNNSTLFTAGATLFVTVSF